MRARQAVRAPLGPKAEAALPHSKAAAPQGLAGIFGLAREGAAHMAKPLDNCGVPTRTASRSEAVNTELPRRRSSKNLLPQTIPAGRRPSAQMAAPGPLYFDPG